MKLWARFFSFGDRLGRGAFWFRILLPVLGLGALFAFTQIFGKPMGGIQSPTGVQQRYAITGWAALPLVVVFIMSLWMLLAANIRRFHDHNLSGWWVAGSLVLMFVLLGLHKFTVTLSGNVTVYRPFGDGFLSWIPVVLAFALWLYFLVKLGFQRGTIGPNHYGPDPVE